MAVLALAASAAASSTAAKPTSGLTVTGNPSLYPSFRPAVHAYVARCRPRRWLHLSFTAPSGEKVAVDGRKARGGSFSRALRVSSGQAVRFTAINGKRRVTYQVRCLPVDFPEWKSAKFGPTQAAYYVVAPCCGKATYVAIFNTNGVPVWWINTHRPPLDASLAPNGDIIWAQQHGRDLAVGISAGTYEQHLLDGKRVRTFSIPGGTPTDRHELQFLPNGDYVVVGYKPRSGVDLSPWGGPAKATVLDALVEEVTPKHKVVWRWNSKDHINLAETGRWYKQYVLANPAHMANGTPLYDIVHINAVARYGPKHFLISLRHTDAVYDVAKSTGNVVWKLGGLHTPKSLQIVGDAVPDFGGQHDVRVLPDGTISLHDNGTARGRGPRVLRFRVHPKARTATLIQKITNPLITFSPCCGSARKLPAGNWVISWGGTPYIEEVNRFGGPVFSLSFPELLSYRAFPVLPGRLSRSALDAGMDKMHPRR